MNVLLNKIKKGINEPKMIFLYIIDLPFVNRLIPDKVYLKIKFRLIMGKKLDLKNPVTWSEKCQWLKLYNRKDEYTMMADKYAVRDYIAETIGEEYLIPLLGVWDNADDIDFDKLPDKFVLKCNHNSGKGMCICKDKSKLDFSKVRKELNEGLKEKYFYAGREWAYKNIKPRIVAEEYIESSDGDLRDYKFYCFDGYVDSVMVVADRQTDVKYYYFNKDWELLRYNELGKSLPEGFSVFKPPKMDEMWGIAEKLSKGHPNLRVDLYNENGKIYFGELTFFDNGGYKKKFDYASDKHLGDLIVLPPKTR